jgi:hypothetical protein
MTHQDLVDAAYKWLLSIGCSFAFKELKTYAHEQPDAIGWKNGKSILVECKTSQTDFLADQKKFFRAFPWMGVGSFRFYLCPAGIINKNDLPERWGLLYCSEKRKRIKKVHAPKGNVWEDKWRFEKNSASEILMLCSALRRVHKTGNLEEILYAK